MDLWVVASIIFMICRIFSLLQFNHGMNLSYRFMNFKIFNTCDINHSDIIAEYYATSVVMCAKLCASYNSCVFFGIKDNSCHLQSKFFNCSNFSSYRSLYYLRSDVNLTFLGSDIVVTTVPQSESSTSTPNALQPDLLINTTGKADTTVIQPESSTHTSDESRTTILQPESSIRTADEGSTATDGAETTVLQLKQTTATPLCDSGGQIVGGICVCHFGCSGDRCDTCYNDCRDGTYDGQTGTKAAWIKPEGFVEAKQVMCQFDYGITYIQRRPHGNINFNRSFDEYDNGFGDINGDFWLGNKYIYIIANLRSFTMDCKFYSTAEGWQTFIFYNMVMKNKSNGYSLSYSSVSDSSNYFSAVFEQSFKTFDMNGCAANLGGGWWFEPGCLAASLNSPIPGTIAGVNSVTQTKIGLY